MHGINPLQGFRFLGGESINTKLIERIRNREYQAQATVLYLLCSAHRIIDDLTVKIATAGGFAHEGDQQINQPLENSLDD